MSDNIPNDSVLILGSQGMLGSQLSKVFGAHAIGWDKQECDVTDLEETRVRLFRLKPGVVINCVAFNDVDGAEEKVDLAYKLNVAAVGNIAAACKELGIPLVHFSTNYVFDGKTGEYREDDEPNPQSIYGKTKHQGEIELAKQTDKYYLVRTAVLFGPKGVSDLSKKSFVEIMLDLANKKEVVRAVNDEINSLTYASDLAMAVKQLLDDKKPFGVYHIVNSGQASWYTFAKEIFRLVKKDVDLIPVPAAEFARKATRPAKSVLINTKLPILRPWQAALAEFLTNKL